MPERYLNDPKLMARAVKHCVSSVRWLTGALMGVIFWAMVVTALLFIERAEDAQILRDQRHEDCLAAIETRDAYRQNDIDQWTAAVESAGPNPEQVAQATEFITNQYAEMGEPGACK